MQCHIASELMSLRLDAMLTAEQERQLEEHLAACQPCRCEWEGLLEAMALFEDPEWVQPPEDMTEMVMQRIRRRSLWAAGLRTMALLVLASAVALAIGALPMAAILGVAIESPSLFSALVSIVVRSYDVIGTLLAAFASFGRAMLEGTGSLILAAVAVVSVACSIQWMRVVARPRRLVSK